LTGARQGCYPAEVPAALWTDAFLDRQRLAADPLADAVIAAIHARGDLEAVNRLMQGLVTDDGVPSARLDPAVRDYLEQVDRIPRADPAALADGQALFELYGPEILVVLGFCSLPAAYAARKGVQVLYRTAYLTKRPVRRVFETTQMVVDVMQQGGLGPSGRGIRSAEKVRLMHAAVRHLILHDPALRWDVSELGLPINQEDLAGTLMTFSTLVLEGLARLGVELTAAEETSYLTAWNAVGRVMGLDEALIPADRAEALTLTRIIRRRQIAACGEGRALTAALIEGMGALMPKLLDGLAGSLIHFFLDADVFQGEDVAALLGVPPANWTRHLVRGIADIADALSFAAQDSPAAARFIRLFSREFVEALLLVDRGPARPGFLIPETLRSLWAGGPLPRGA
jgi:hypothetical protein